MPLLWGVAWVLVQALCWVAMLGTVVGTVAWVAVVALALLPP